MHLITNIYIPLLNIMRVFTLNKFIFSWKLLSIYSIDGKYPLFSLRIFTYIRTYVLGIKETRTSYKYAKSKHQLKFRKR
jgi:hypothetical protein